MLTVLVRSFGSQMNFWQLTLIIHSTRSCSSASCLRVMRNFCLPPGRSHWSGRAETAGVGKD